MGLTDPDVAPLFDIEVGMQLEQFRTKEKTEAEERQLEVLAAATGVTITKQAVG